MKKELRKFVANYLEANKDDIFDTLFFDEEVGCDDMIEATEEYEKELKLLIEELRND